MPKRSGLGSTMTILICLVLIGNLSACFQASPKEIQGAKELPTEPHPGDLDADGVLDPADNCLMTVNPDQGDMDDDKVGDLCDLDRDGDFVRNELDVWPNDRTQWASRDTNVDPGLPPPPTLVANDADTNEEETDPPEEAGEVVIDEVVTEIFWVAPAGDDNNPGTIDRPLQTIAKGIEKAIAAGGTKPVNVVEGFYPEDLVVGSHLTNTGIHLFGGFGPLDPGTLTRNRDIRNHLTTFKGITIDGRAGTATNTMETQVDGFHFAKTLILNASPIFQQNTIILDGSACEGSVPVIMTTSGIGTFQPTFLQNFIENRDCHLNESVDAHVAVQMASHEMSRLEPVLNGNEIVSQGGLSGADAVIALLGTAFEESSLFPHLWFNSILTDDALVYAAGINLWSKAANASADLDAQNNRIRLNLGPSSRGIDLGFNGIAGRLEIFSGSMILRNTILAGSGNESSTGIAVHNAKSENKISNNFIHSGIGSAVEKGIALFNANAIILSNTLVADSTDRGVLIDLNRGATGTRIENNIFFGNGSGEIGVREGPDGLPRTLVNNLFDPTIDILYSSLNSGDITTIEGLLAVDPLFAPNLSGQALLVDPPQLDLHLQEGSAAIDAFAIGSFPETDIDGDPKPFGAAFDAGADEWLQDQI